MCLQLSLKQAICVFTSLEECLPKNTAWFAYSHRLVCSWFLVQCTLCLVQCWTWISGLSQQPGGCPSGHCMPPHEIDITSRMRRHVPLETAAKGRTHTCKWSVGLNIWGPCIARYHNKGCLVRCIQCQSAVFDRNQAPMQLAIFIYCAAVCREA